ncbi:DUF550 domain-containing protein [Salmonella enterica subsp. enterica serovar Ohio]|nr:DUF550 domain-containing protein [Salmonella enterica subsp. enterica serovar Ohio]EED9694030.1 DUF550 domain-containing protein [Salmonella enterica subsp. enterica serovar Ohio]
MTTITKEEVKAFIEQIESDLSNGWEAQIFELKLARIALASLEAEPVAYIFKHPAGELFWSLTDESNKGQNDVMPVYAAPPAPERERIRREHAEWSYKTFGDVGPIGPLKHLSKEALEAAAEPDDLSEWADMQFLLWDAQRRAGISDSEITAAMVEKLEINKSRQWSEPKDGEPRLHIKEQPMPVVPDEWTIQDAVKFCRETGRQDAGSAMEAWNACRAAMLQGVEQPQNARQNIPENIPDGNSPAIPDDWVMVPRVPTTEMANAMIGVDGCSTSELLVALKLAIAAAPQQEAE